MARPPDASGRAGFQPSAKDSRLVELSAAYGVPDDQVARALGISPTVLRTTFERELARGDFRANSQVAESLFRQAVSGNATAAIWWSKARMGWTDPAHAVNARGIERDTRVTVILADPRHYGPATETSDRGIALVEALAPAKETP